MEPFITRDGRYLLFNNSNDPLVDTNLHYAERIDDLTFAYRGEIAVRTKKTKPFGVPQRVAAAAGSRVRSFSGRTIALLQQKGWRSVRHLSCDAKMTGCGGNTAPLTPSSLGTDSPDLPAIAARLCGEQPRKGDHR